MQRFANLRNRLPSTDIREILQGSARDLRKYLAHINSAVRGISARERKLEMQKPATVFVERHLAPPSRVQDYILELGAQAIVEINDTRYGAELGYILVNNLHLFHDGNGRTARAVYQILSDAHCDLLRSPYIQYHARRASGNSTEFEKEYGITNIKTLYDKVRKAREAYLIQRGQIDPRFADARISIPISQSIPKPFYTAGAEQGGLRYRELLRIGMLLIDESVSALALEQMLTKKGLVDDILPQKLHDTEINIFVEGNPYRLADDEQCKSACTFRGWIAEDYREFKSKIHLEQIYQNEAIVLYYKRLAEQARRLK